MREVIRGDLQDRRRVLEAVHLVEDDRTPSAQHPQEAFGVVQQAADAGQLAVQVLEPGRRRARTILPTRRTPMSHTTDLRRNAERSLCSQTGPLTIRRYVSGGYYHTQTHRRGLISSGLALTGMTHLAGT